MGLLPPLDYEDGHPKDAIGLATKQRVLSWSASDSTRPESRRREGVKGFGRRLTLISTARPNPRASQYRQARGVARLATLPRSEQRRRIQRVTPSGTRRPSLIYIPHGSSRFLSRPEALSWERHTVSPQHRATKQRSKEFLERYAALSSALPPRQSPRGRRQGSAAPSFAAWRCTNRCAPPPWR